MRVVLSKIQHAGGRPRTHARRGARQDQVRARVGVSRQSALLGCPGARRLRPRVERVLLLSRRIPTPSYPPRRSTRTSVGSSSCSAAANNSGTGAIGGTTARSFVTITSRRVPNRTSVARGWWLWRRDWRRARNKQMNAVATRSMRVARGASKALAAQYAHKAGFADNAARRAIVHHWGAGGGGSHYHTAGSKQFLKGCGSRVWCRDTKQGARLGRRACRRRETRPIAATRASRCYDRPPERGEREKRRSTKRLHIPRYERERESL